MDQSVVKMGSALRNLHLHAEKIDLLNAFLEMVLEMISNVTMIQNELNESWDSIRIVQKILVEANIGKLSWELFGGETFRQVLIDLEIHLPSNWRLLYTIEEHFAYLNYINANTFTNGENLHICADIPIVDRNTRYNLYEAIAMPVVNPAFPESLFFSYQFKDKFIAISAMEREPTDRQYFVMGAEQRKQCRGENPIICPLTQAVKTPSQDINPEACLFALYSNEPNLDQCPLQVEYKEGPIFENLGSGNWLYGAATGKLLVQCTNRGTTQATREEYQLSGTGVFRLQPGCQATFGETLIPSFVHGKGQVKSDLPVVPIVEAFSLNYTESVISNMTNLLRKPDDYRLFLEHLVNKTEIKHFAMSVEEFNSTIEKYEDIRKQLPYYHPFRWISRPKSQVSGFVILFLINLASTLILAIWIRRISRRINDLSLTPAPENAIPLIRRRRRRRVPSEASV